MQDIDAALDVEEAALSQIHRTVAKQIARLELEERMLKMLQDRLTEEVAQQAGNAPQGDTVAQPAAEAVEPPAAITVTAPAARPEAVPAAVSTTPPVAPVVPPAGDSRQTPARKPAEGITGNGDRGPLPELMLGVEEEFVQPVLSQGNAGKKVARGGSRSSARLKPK